MDDSSPISMAQIVVKTTKYCNLRCSYCYEHEELHNKHRMSLEEIRTLYENVRGWAIERKVKNLQFVWHGGEPLLVPLEFYEEAKSLQDAVFGNEVPVSNAIQSNLTVLTDRHIDFLKRGEFVKNIGISFDVYGEQRIDTRGKLRTETILRNIQKLVDHEVDFGAICVLARGTRPHVREIYRFFDELGVSTRFLPFFETGLAWQENLHALSNAEIAAGLIDIFEERLTSSRATPSLPNEHYLAIAVYSMAGRPWPRFNRRTDESVFVVNTDGGVWGEPEAYDPEFQFGNLFRSDLREILRSPGREKAVAGSEDRQETFCRTCPYHESCSGYFIASNLAYEITPSTPHRCVARDVADYMVDRLERSELRDEIVTTYAERVDNGALAVSL